MERDRQYNPSEDEQQIPAQTQETPQLYPMNNGEKLRVTAQWDGQPTKLLPAYSLPCEDYWYPTDD